VNERRRQRRISIRLTTTQWAVIAEALGQMVKIQAARLESLVQGEGPASAGNLSGFDALSRTYADLVRELAQAGLADTSARTAAQTLDEASALLESRVSGGGRQ
jgi:hypothetical protein